jgi:predicted dehydrogenase
MQRRDFIKHGVVGVASSPLTSKLKGANDKIVAGLIGLGGRGSYELELCLRNKSIEVAAVADVFDPLVAKALRQTGGKAAGYRDFRRILDRKDIDVVFVSTPDHWHAIPTILACQAGKDVFCEKPLSHTVEEGRRMVEAARKYDRVVQTGSQQRSSVYFAEIIKLIRSGYIGRVTMIECWNLVNNYPEGIGNPPDEDPPPGLDWDMYLGPAPKVPYNRNRFLWNFRWFWDYSGGIMTDWGAHHFDVIHWAMGVEAPSKVAAVGGKFCLRDNRETPDTFMAVFEYPGFLARFTERDANGMQLANRGGGMLFYGTLGTLALDRSHYEILPEMKREGDSEAIDRIEQYRPGYAARTASAPLPLKPLCEPRKGADIWTHPGMQEAHIENFLDCVRSRKQPAADVEIGHRAATACQLAVIAYKAGRAIRWDSERETIMGDSGAQRYLTKTYRAPWALPRV